MNAIERKTSRPNEREVIADNFIIRPIGGASKARLCVIIRRVLTRTVRQFLKQPRIACLATLGRDGYPHIVPIYFMLDDDDIIFASDDNERKVVNARHHLKGAVVIGGEPETDDAGYMIQGDLSIKNDRQHKLLRRLAKRYEVDKDEQRDWINAETVIIRLKPRRIIRVW